jgi:hypothetical protein
MNEKQAYEAYRLECAKRTGYTNVHYHSDNEGAGGWLWGERNGDEYLCIIPEYKDDTCIDYVVRGLNYDDIKIYFNALVSNWEDGCLPAVFMLQATADQKRMALYKVFGIEVTE